MRNSTVVKYSGNYRISREPHGLASHNEISWDRIRSHINATADHQASFDKLCDVVKEHMHCGKRSGDPHLFLIHCIRNGWLAKV